MRRPIASGTVETEFRVLFATEAGSVLPVDSQVQSSRDEAEERINEGVRAGNNAMRYSVERRIVAKSWTAWEEVE